MLGCYNGRLFLEKYTVKDLISNTKRVQRILLVPRLNRINSIWPPYRSKGILRKSHSIRGSDVTCYNEKNAQHKTDVVAKKKNHSLPYAKTLRNLQQCDLLQCVFDS